MKLVVGLGNPGTKYLKNRHNVGHMFVDYLQKTPHTGMKLFKTDCYMNQSGGFVRRLLASHKSASPADLYIVHDDLDIPLGKYKIQFGSGPKVHNGVNSVTDALHTDDFWRIRIGVDARTPDNRTDGESYVLGDFNFDELHIVSALFEKICNKL